MANENEQTRRNDTAGGDGSGGADSPIPPIKNPAVEGARPRRNYWLPWILLALAILALIAMLTQCGRDEDKINEAIARDRAMQQQAGAAGVTAAAPGTYQQGTLAYDVNQHLLSNARGERTFTFGQLNFDTGSAQIRDVDRSDIVALAQVLAAHPNVRAVVVGYADARGDARDNAQLGQQRAQAVIEALRARGVNTGNLQARSGGELNPVAGDTAQGMAQNRRTEFVILGR